MTVRHSCHTGEISCVPVKWQEVETPTQRWDLLTTHWGSRKRNERQNKKESDRRDWAEERSDGTVVNPPTRQWDPGEYIKWKAGRFGRKKQIDVLFSIVVITWTFFHCFSLLQSERLKNYLLIYCITTHKYQFAISRCVWKWNRLSLSKNQVKMLEGCTYFLIIL